MGAGPGASESGRPVVGAPAALESTPFARVPRNVAAAFAARVVAAAATTALLAIAAHRLDVDDFGLVVSTMAAGFIANTLITFGTDTLVTRAVAGDEPDTDRLVAATLRLQLVAAAAVVAAATVAVGAGAPLPLLVEAASLLPLAVVTVAGAIVRGAERMHHLLVAATVGSTVSLGALAAGFAIDDAAVVPIAARALGNVAAAVVLWRTGRSIRPRVGPLLRRRLHHVAEVVRRAAPFATMVVLAAVGGQAGLLLVELLADEPSGGYGAAVRLFEAARLLPASIVAAVFPALVGMPDQAAVRRWRGLLGAYAVAATIVLIAVADPVNRVLFDDQPSGTDAIRILAIGLPLTVLRLQLSVEAIAANRERVVVLSAALGTALMLTAGVLLAGPFGVAGVVWSQVAGIGLAALVLLADRGVSADRAAQPSPPAR